MRAKDDVLNRLGGSIGMANGQTVRIGFGKADSAPVTPSGPNSGGTHSSHFLTTGSVASTTNGTSGLNSPGAGMDAQLQSSPTRALWIGSIPSTTTPATILSVFSPFGPIESARVLTHKNCGFGMCQVCWFSGFQ
jgi:protein JSN1